MKIIEKRHKHRSLHINANRLYFFISLINTIVSYFPYEVNKWREGSVKCRNDLYTLGESLCTIVFVVI